jgi:hypothetical protein
MSPSTPRELLTLFRGTNVPHAVLRTLRKTGSVSSAPPEVSANSIAVWRRAAAPYALGMNVEKRVRELR